MQNKITRMGVRIRSRIVQSAEHFYVKRDIWGSTLSSGLYFSVIRKCLQRSVHHTLYFVHILIMIPINGP